MLTYSKPLSDTFQPSGSTHSRLGSSNKKERTNNIQTRPHDNNIGHLGSGDSNRSTDKGNNQRVEGMIKLQRASVVTSTPVKPDQVQLKRSASDVNMDRRQSNTHS